MRHVPAAAVAVLTLAGCAIEPTPDQTTGSYTTQIANHVRCEARQAIIARAVSLLINNDRVPLADVIKTGDATTISNAIRKDLPKLPPLLRDQINGYLGIVVAYQFTLDITEQNVNKIEVNLLGPFSGGGGTLGLGAGLDRSRQNIRIFTITDTFRHLAEDGNVCREPAVRIDYIYPMAGQIGVDDAVKNFVDLNELSRKSGENILKTDKNGGAEVYATTFRFKTIVDGAFNPGGTTTPSIFGPASGTLTNTARRTDDHQVIVGFSLPDKASAGASKGVTSSPSAGAALFGPDVATRRTTTASDAGERARQAIRDAKVDYFLQNFNTGFASPR